MTQQENENFFSGPEVEKAPEVESRLFFLIADDNTPYSIWQVVQEGIYAYMITHQMSRFSVRIIISDLLAAEIIWDESEPQYDIDDK